MSRRLLVLGCGYIGAEVCRRAPDAGWAATGIVRSEASRARLAAEGLDVRALDVVQGDLVALGGGWDAVLVALSAGGRGESAYGEVYAEAPARLAAWASSIGVRSLLLLSSTGVYRQAGVVDETSPAGGDGPSDALVAGERAALAAVVPSRTVLRLGGLYGPGRHYLLDQLRRGDRVVGGVSDHRINYLHRDDAATACLAALAAGEGAHLYNVTDGHPVTKASLATWICERLGNPALTPEALADCGDLATILAGKSTYPEAIMEFAGRVCYNSTQRMGTAPEFIAARVREQHEDIVEHVVVTVRVHGTQEPMGWRMHNRHCEVSQLGEMEWLVSANVRVWLDFFRKGIALVALPLLWPVAPAVFREISAAPPAAAQGAQPLPAFSHAFQRADQSVLLPIEQGLMRVTLLGYTQPVLDDPALLLDHGSATFFFEGISRACTHQLVRHRLASFSQESQRYVALSKGGWQAIVPPAIAANPEAQAELAEFWQIAEQKYTRLRELGIRKEDARFLLPNAAQTRIVATMNYAAWSHFLWLRAVDKAAQWEIRALGQAVLHVLYWLAPAVFAEQWRVYQEQIAS